MSFVRYSLFLLLSGCSTVQSGGVITNKPFCELFQPITYSAKNDTQETITQIRKFNAGYLSLCK